MIDRLTRARKAPADLVLRAQIIVLSWDGLRVAAIAVELGCHAKTVRWWLHRFNELGVEGLEDRPVAGPVAAPDHRGREVPDHRAGQTGATGTSDQARGRRTGGAGRVRGTAVDTRRPG
nr:helix-turn-helix domain-containing protein [Streptomyces sp. So13.3]